MAERIGFKRNIGLFMAVMIGIGAMMGPGIFALPGELAKMVGPLGIFAYLAMGLVTVFTALNYSELGAAVEEDEVLCEELEKRYHVPIFQGDGSKEEVLKQVGAENVDVAIAASDDDGRNVIVALQAKRLGIEQVIRGKEFVVPRGDTKIETGDHVVFVGPPSAVKNAQDMFTLRP